MQDVRHVLYLVVNLKLNPNSQTFALNVGNQSARGWDSTTIALARIHNMLVGALAGKGKDISELLMTFPVGEEPEEAVPFAPTIAEFNAKRFMQQMT